MYCREVKRRLNNKTELSTELIEHLKNCPVCAREAELAEMLDSALLSAKMTGDDSTPFAELKSRIITYAAEKHIEELSLMAKIKREIEHHPKFSLGVAFTIAVIAIMLLVPVSYNKTVGYDLSFKSPQQAGIVSQEQLIKLVSALGYGSAQVDIDQIQDGSEYRIANLPDNRAAREVEMALTEVTGQRGQVKVKPVVKAVTGSLYAQVKERTRVEIVTKSKSDEEIQQEIQTKLKEMGINFSDFKIKSSKGGSWTITLPSNDSTGRTPLNDIIWIDFNEQGNLEIGPIDEFPGATVIDIRGKTKDEVKQEITQKLKARGVTDPQIEVLGDDNDNVEVRIKKDKEN